MVYSFSTSVPDAAVEWGDLIVADHSMHWATDITRTLQRMKDLIRDDGFAIVIENTCEYELAFGVDALRRRQLPAIGDGNRIYGWQ